MQRELYEELNYPDYYFPIIYHLDVLSIRNSEVVFRAHWHGSVEILYFVEGRAQIKCDDKLFEAKAGDIIIVNSNQMHTISPKNECVYHCFIAAESLFEQNNVALSNINFSNHISNDAALNLIYENIISEMNEKNSQYKLAVKGYFNQFLVILMRNYINDAYSDKNSQKMIDAIKSSIIYMEENFAFQLSLDKISRSANMSKYYFCRVFKETVGKTPMEYLSSIRVNKAANLLKEGSMNVYQTAEKCGFNSYSYFSKVFKRYFGVSPSSFRAG